MTFFPKVLSRSQQQILPKLDFLRGEGMYLAGGTALALQLGHRTSVDFDFYTQKHFDSAKLLLKFRRQFKALSVSGQDEDTLLLDVEGSYFSGFYYPYKLIGKLKQFGSLDLAEVGDIAAMKIVAIIQRGKKRDFIDIYFLLKKYSLKQLISFTKQKYSVYDEILILKALSYFEDADQEETSARSIRVFDQTFSWKKAKQAIFSQIKDYQLAMLQDR